MSDSDFILAHARSLGLDPDGPSDGRLLYHPDSTDEIERSPFVVVVEDGECRATVAHFSDGDIVPGLSVTIDAAGSPLRATSSFGTSVDPAEAAAEIAQAIRLVYDRATRAEVL